MPQTAARMVPASQAIYEHVVEKRIAHDGDPALRRHVRNAVARQTPRGWRLDKLKAKKKMDAVIAMAMAVFMAQTPPPEVKRSVYEDRGIIQL